LHFLSYYQFLLQKIVVLLSTCAAAFLVASVPTLTHGFAGSRFFPATLATDDPFVADECRFQLFRPSGNQALALPAKTFDLSAVWHSNLLQTSALKLGMDTRCKNH
jgi:hypothetical protein